MGERRLRLVGTTTDVEMEFLRRSFHGGLRAVEEESIAVEQKKRKQECVVL